MKAKPIPQALRARVLERDGYTCCRCFRLLQGNYYSLHHRLPRSRGGKHTAENIVTVCGSGTSPDGCHLWIETNRQRAYEEGWLIYTGMDPASSPVLRGGAWLQPTVDGWVEVQGGLVDSPQGSDHPAA